MVCNDLIEDQISSERINAMTTMFFFQMKVYPIHSSVVHSDNIINTTLFIGSKRVVVERKS